ncbi:hypothetical protein AGABI1DRAFT_131444 [Agaricus bisporus var. burnettii JB137-S8]|uniref:DH domain-containing protein n=1 Tax=Agaricus bisporus var. burnettii (strain JB137-S8 / ATCC MYA-4627 / FGSC 10392) TaxID=597362 RepID=K5VPF7_AGABU|nr:uncharacterized protein AGABI1DRAFT_131444 [Agaricus bisporus var. burnettii JB137-S8]EKM76359.1 hypothetical protein AGABI1DRAFT_131444 [Agaricus bisporus var. burnettii JB137-S8]
MPSATSRPARPLASPNTGAGFTTQHPTFYPPSYYAAANGFSYSQKRRTGAVQPVIASRNGYSDTASHYESFMPVSYIPNTSSSESSFEIKHPPTNHYNNSHASKSSKLEKRQSQITGLPQLEANLLPSLRDTVGRMTRAPPPVAPSQYAFAQDDDPRQPREHASSVLKSNNPPSDFSSNAHDPRLLQKREFLSPRDPPPSDDSCSIHSTPPRTKGLKSTPRTLTPRTFQGQETPRADSGAASSPRHTSLRPIKSILTRKSPTCIAPTTASVGSSKNTIHKSSLQTPKPNLDLPRSPSRTGHQQSKGRLHHTSPANINALEREKHGKSPRPEKHLNSNIPRFRARPVIDHPQISFSDSSDLERRYEQGRKEQRKLTVTNAGPLSNSSSSDHNYGVKFPLRQPQSGVGLGLDYHFPEAKSNRVKLDNESSNIRPGNAARNAPRVSIVSFASSVSCYSTASDDLPLAAQPKSDYERQREALLKLVSTLDQKPQRRTTRSSESSDYHGVEGVAYSASSELVAHDELRQNFVVPNTRPKELRRRSQYMPGSMPISVVESSLTPSPRGETRPETNEIGGTTARLARRSLMIAAQEREAFGLRPSDSEEYRREYEKLRHHSRYGSHLSESSVEDLNESQDGALSHEASHMFHSIQATSHPPEHSGSVLGNGDFKRELPKLEKHRALKTNSPIISPKAEAPRHTAEESVEEPLSKLMDQLWETERNFVKQMQTCIQYYVLPLRVHGSRAWISGVPPDISRFLDWFEDILHLHEQVLEISRGPKYDVIRQIVLFLPRFETYQPYIARLEEFSRRLRNLQEGESDFGCFVDLQDKQMQKTGWSLARYISEPEKRLQGYLQLFSDLLQITPRQDPQYIPVFSLVRSIELIVDVLNTVKQEEQEHQSIVTLLARFESPCSLGYLADRKRTLLWNGRLVLRCLSSEDRRPHHMDKELDTRTRTLSRVINASGDKGSDISHFDGHRKSFSSYGSGSGYSMTEDGFQEEPLGLYKNSTRSIQVSASVFSDIVIFGEPVPGTSNSNPMSYRLLDSIGLARVFSVQERVLESGERLSNPEKRYLTTVDSNSVLVELIPINSADSNLRNMIPRIECIQISQPESASCTSTPDICQDCFSAFRRSRDHTTQLWCRPWKNINTITPQIPTTYGDSGLPLLKSPPGSQAHASKPRPRDTSVSIEEREERSWWSFRFHQVMTSKRQVTFSV